MLLEIDAFKSLELRVGASVFAKKLLASKFFVYVGTLYISEECCCDSDFNKNITEILRIISGSKVLQLETLRLHGTKPNPDVLANAMCRIKSVTLQSVRFSASDLKKIYRKIVSCKSLELEAFCYSQLTSEDADTILSKTDPDLFAEVVIRMRLFGGTVDKKLAKAVLDKAHDSQDSKLEILDLEVWNFNPSGRRACDYNYHEQFFSKYPKEKFLSLKSKLKDLTLSIHGKGEDEYDSDESEYDYEYGSSDTDDDLAYDLEQYDRYIEKFEKERYQQKLNSLAMKMFGGGGGRLHGL